MEKTKRKNVLKRVMIALSIVFFVCVATVTFAWLTDKKEYGGTLTFGEITLDVSGSGVTESTATLNFDIARNPASQKIMPGDSVSLSLNVGLASTSDPAYYLMFLSDTRGVFEDACYYSDGTTVHALDGVTKNVGSISSTSSHSIVLNGSVAEDYKAQGGITQVFLNIYAIQQANLPSDEAYDKLFEQHYKLEGVQLKSVDDFKTGLGGTTATKTYTTVGFYDSDEYDAVANGYSLDSTLTTSMNSNLKDLDKNKNLIQVYKKSNDIAIVSATKILAPKDCYDMFNYFDVATTIDVTNLDTSRAHEIGGMFNCVYSNAPHTALTTIVGLENFNTTNARSLQGMFQGCYKLTSLSGIETWDTSNVRYMQYMFNYCQSLTSLDVSNFNTSNVTDMRVMFYGLGLTSSSSEVTITGLS
ncbi:MAG: BspA family leucine-rich repeat surface protein, partial [Christensenellales bacterium]